MRRPALLAVGAAVVSVLGVGPSTAGEVRDGAPPAGTTEVRVVHEDGGRDCWRSDPQL